MRKRRDPGRSENSIADRSEDMKQTVDKFLDYEKTQQRFQRLQNELELAGD
jgi:vacuolar-type H+-ATPase subunit D/Vma8